MYGKMRQIAAVLMAMFLVSFLDVHANAAEPEAGKQQAGKKVETKVEKRELKISGDGKYIVDQKGRVVAKFVKGSEVKPASDTERAGCLCCADECVIYDRNGVCVKKVRSCTYDFECSCRN